MSKNPLSYGITYQVIFSLAKIRFIYFLSVSR